MKPVICTVSGIDLDLLKPAPAMISIRDVAVGLSHAARFAGQTETLYTVAQHSVLVFDLVRKWAPDDLFRQRVALLHDAAEAYVGDCTTPLKTNLPAYRVIEHRIRDAIFEALDCPWRSERLPGIVKRADRWALHAEGRDLTARGHAWTTAAGAPDVSSVPRIVPLEPLAARDQFLIRWESLAAEAGR